MQALIIQQDSISDLYEAVTSAELDIRALDSWQAVRTLRNACAGHPAKRDRPKNFPVTRTFMGRRFGGYPAITYEQWQAQGGISHPTVKLAALTDGHAKEAEAKLVEVLQSMKEQWPPSTKQKC